MFKTDCPVVGIFKPELQQADPRQKDHRYKARNSDAAGVGYCNQCRGFEAQPPVGSLNRCSRPEVGSLLTLVFGVVNLIVAVVVAPGKEFLVQLHRGRPCRGWGSWLGVGFDLVKTHIKPPLRRRLDHW